MKTDRLQQAIVKAAMQLYFARLGVRFEKKDYIEEGCSEEEALKEIQTRKLTLQCRETAFDKICEAADVIDTSLHT